MTLPSALDDVRLRPLALPHAPAVVRASAVEQPRPRAAAVVLLVLGLLLVVGPVAGGLFVKVASGQQMIDAFEPHLTPDALDRYDGDLATLRTGAHALRARKVDATAYPGVAAYRKHGAEIDRRATRLLTTIRAAEPDYRKVSDIGGFDRVPFLLVLGGLGLTYAGAVLLGGRRQRAGGAVVLALVAAVSLVAYPLLGNLREGTSAGERLQHALAPVMTRTTVQTQQRDFVVLVHALGELDTSYRPEYRGTPQAKALDALVAAWPAVSSDLAALVGTINDSITDYRALEDLDGSTSGLGFSGLKAMPWFLIGAGAIAAVAALASSPRLRPSRKVRP